jgi:hypothetical protein
MQKAKARTPLSKVALVLAFSLWVLPASSQKQSSTTFGTPDCGQWIAEKTPSRRGWLLGYLTGLNWLHDEMGNNPKDPLDALNSAEQAFLWMDNWCKANPLKNLRAGGVDLFIELMEKKAKENKK